MERTFYTRHTAYIARRRVKITRMPLGERKEN